MHKLYTATYTATHCLMLSQGGATTALLMAARWARSAAAWTVVQRVVNEEVAIHAEHTATVTASQHQAPTYITTTAATVS